MNSPLIHNMDEHQGVEPTSSPGTRLRIARQTKRLEISSIASQLHLHPDKIEALEQDRYHDLAGSVFVSGYIRNYARLLDLDPEPLLAAYHAADPDAVPIPKRVVTTPTAPRREARSNDLAVRLVSLVIVLGIAGLFAAWWMNRSEPLFDPTLLDEPPLPAEQSFTMDAPPMDAPPMDEPPMDEPPMDEPLTGEAPMAETVAQPPGAAPAAGQPALPTMSEPPSKPMPGQYAATPTTSEVASELLPKPTESAPDATPGQEPIAAVATEQDAASAAGIAAAEAETTSPTIASVVLEFTGPCWVDVRDADRGFKLFGEKNAGDRFVLEGTPPYDIVLGNASAVKIEINGEPFDLASRSKGNVARFKLEPNDAL